MWNAHFVMIICALVCWAMAAIGKPVPAPYGVGWLGMVFFGLSLLIK